METNKKTQRRKSEKTFKQKKCKKDSKSVFPLFYSEFPEGDEKQKKTNFEKNSSTTYLFVGVVFRSKKITQKVV
jgi:hypothetical protein